MDKKINDSWEEIIIVGYGNHSQTKIIPAIKKTSNAKISIVSKKISKENFYVIYKSLDEALIKSGRKLFVVANPPKFHYHFCKKIMQKGFDVFVEKPAFLEIAHLKELINIANKKGIVLFELLMYLQNSKVQEICDLLNSQINNIHSIHTSFNLPNYPLNTFRNETDFYSSLIDIGCYPISLSSLLNSNIKNIKLENRSLRKNEYAYHMVLIGVRFNIFIDIGKTKFIQMI